MSSPIHITEHVIDAEYVRDNPRATATPDAPLKLCIKKYTPSSNPNPQPGDVTFVATHGTACPKELYEPLWEELLARSKRDGFRIRAIWIADSVNQGASGILNEQHLGNDSTWNDHSRDVLHMISHFRSEMPQPIMGVGHSAGAVQLLFASLCHRSIFSSVLFIEPWFSEAPRASGGALLIILATTKRDTWRSREEATEKARRSLSAWDPRALQRWQEYAYRELPSAVYPSTPTTPGAVTLATTKYQEVMTFAPVNPGPETRVQFLAENPEEINAKQASWIPGRQIYRTEPIAAFKLIPHLSPPALIISGSESPIYESGNVTDAVKIAGTGYGGNGGVASGLVRHVVIDEGTHTLPFEKIAETAEAMGSWISQEVQRWKENNDRLAKEWGPLSTKEKLSFPPEFLKAVETVKSIL